VTGTRYS